MSGGPRKIVKVPIVLSAALYARAKWYAARRDCTVPTWLTEVVESFLAGLGAIETADAPPPRRRARVVRLPIGRSRPEPPGAA